MSTPHIRDIVRSQHAAQIRRNLNTARELNTYQHLYAAGRMLTNEYTRCGCNWEQLEAFCAEYSINYSEAVCAMHHHYTNERKK